jgi:uncharacterized protein (DUF433 family)
MSIGVGTGIYTPREASRLTGLSVQKVRGWLDGYPNRGAPLIHRDAADSTSLSFLDLIEIIFVKAFRSAGVKMSTIRRASKNAEELLGSYHPFAVSRFETDGRVIFARLDEKRSSKKHMVDIDLGQSVFERVVSPYLKQIDYHSSGSAIRWWPLGKGKPIFLDPKISFGVPVTKTANVPVYAISAALLAGETPRTVAKWFEIPLRDVKAAAALEQRMAA